MKPLTRKQRRRWALVFRAIAAMPRVHATGGVSHWRGDCEYELRLEARQ